MSGIVTRVWGAKYISLFFLFCKAAAVIPLSCPMGASEPAESGCRGGCGRRGAGGRLGAGLRCPDAVPPGASPTGGSCGPAARAPPGGGPGSGARTPPAARGSPPLFGSPQDPAETPSCLSNGNKVSLLQSRLLFSRVASPFTPGPCPLPHPATRLLRALPGCPPRCTRRRAPPFTQVSRLV